MARLPIAWFAVLLLLHATPLEATDGLRIALIPPDEATQVVAGNLWRVFLDGPIDPQAAQRLAVELSRNNVQWGFAFLNSPGGSLKAGMEIGRLLRKHGLLTYIRKRVGSRDVPGQCLSACVYAFVGGYFRYLSEHDTVGVHRFSTAMPTVQDLDAAQIMSGAITAYLREMDVDVGLFELMTRIASDKIHKLSLIEAKNLRVANNGYQPATWSIEAFDEGFYLRGSQETWYGLGKVTFVCDKSIVYFSPFYEAGSNSDTIVGTALTHFLRLGDEFVDIGKPIKPLSVLNGFISATFVLPPPLVERVKSANSVGYAAQPGNPDLFWGFTVEVGKDRKKVVAYFAQCSSNRKQ